LLTLDFVWMPQYGAVGAALASTVGVRRVDPLHPVGVFTEHRDAVVGLPHRALVGLSAFIREIGSGVP